VDLRIGSRGDPERELLRVLQSVSRDIKEIPVPPYRIVRDARRKKKGRGSFRGRSGTEKLLIFPLTSNGGYKVQAVPEIWNGFRDIGSLHGSNRFFSRKLDENKRQTSN